MFTTINLKPKTKKKLRKMKIVEGEIWDSVVNRLITNNTHKKRKWSATIKSKNLILVRVYKIIERRFSKRNEEMINLEKLKGKNIFLKTTYGRFMTIEVDNDTTEETLCGLDKYGFQVMISIEDISSLSVSGTKILNDK